MLFWLLLGLAAFFVYHHLKGRPPGRPRGGAGASAARQAARHRTPLVRIATAAGVSTKGERTAARWSAGAEGERRTAARLEPLAAEGWTILHDRALPGSRANLDHFAVSPTGRVFLPDTKRYSSRYPLTVRAGRLWRGDRDITGWLDGLRHETRIVAEVLGVPVTALVVVDGAELRGPHGRPVPELNLPGLRIIPAESLTTVLRAAARLPGQRSRAELVTVARRKFPPYTR
ncbi:nuclease-related domain-containing protein [Streptomyces sp. G1]|uniref:nuclease-related domain-containing protein n=1 Tax=Streptomyces sp. G1 TaxID=361572 RepID=UPI0027E587B2|nr:nuclease-related domain-containing protein [Streptomyces sp. G1]